MTKRLICKQPLSRESLYPLCCKGLDVIIVFDKHLTKLNKGHKPSKTYLK